MDALRRLLGLAPRQVSPYFDDDDVYPVHLCDNAEHFRELVITWTMRFNDVLDVDKLEDAAAEVLSTGDWRKLGGRLHLKKDGKLEIRVPRVFTPERPPLRCTRVAFDLTLEEHPIACQLPHTTAHPSAHPGGSKFRPLALPPGAPTSFDGYLIGDTPQFSLHTVSFTNATLVSFSWIHTAADATTISTFMSAWSTILAGAHPSSLPPVLGARIDPLDEVDADKPNLEPSILTSLRLTGLALLRFVLLLLWDVLRNPGVEDRTIFLPAPALAQMKKQAQAETNVPSLSDNDVLTAWATRSLLAARGEPRRAANIITVIDVRGRLPSVFRAGAAYLQNLPFPAFVTLHGARRAETETESLGQSAGRIRKAVAAQAAEGQMRANVVAHRAEFAAGRPGPLYGESGALLVVFSNWTRARMHEAVDFGPAVVRACPTDEWPETAPGRMVFHTASTPGMGWLARNVFMVHGRDFGGNYWVTGSLGRGVWESMERNLREGGMGESGIEVKW